MTTTKPQILRGSKFETFIADLLILLPFRTRMIEKIAAEFQIFLSCRFCKSNELSLRSPPARVDEVVAASDFCFDPR